MFPDTILVVNFVLESSGAMPCTEVWCPCGFHQGSPVSSTPPETYRWIGWSKLPQYINEHLMSNISWTFFPPGLYPVFLGSSMIQTRIKWFFYSFYWFQGHNIRKNKLFLTYQEHVLQFVWFCIYEHLHISAVYLIAW